MLVLSRRRREAIVIDGRVKVTVLTISASRVELGVEAPPHVSVDREEIHVRKQVKPPVSASWRDGRRRRGGKARERD
jgi:carbon storage regulator